MIPFPVVMPVAENASAKGYDINGQVVVVKDTDHPNHRDPWVRLHDAMVDKAVRVGWWRQGELKWMSTETWRLVAVPNGDGTRYMSMWRPEWEAQG